MNQQRRAITIPRTYTGRAIDAMSGSYFTEGDQWVRTIEENPYINYSSVDDVIRVMTDIKSKFREGGEASVEIEEVNEYGSPTISVFVRGTRWATDAEAKACEEEWQRAVTAAAERREAEKERIRREFPEMFES